jgi:hypothetical protein
LQSEYLRFKVFGLYGQPAKPNVWEIPNSGDWSKTGVVATLQLISHIHSPLVIIYSPVILAEESEYQGY